MVSAAMAAMSVAARAAKLSKQSSEANKKVDQYLCILSIKAHPQALSSVKHHLVSNGWWLSEDEIKAMEESEAAKKKDEQMKKDSGKGATVMAARCP